MYALKEVSTFSWQSPLLLTGFRVPVGAGWAAPPRAGALAPQAEAGATVLGRWGLQTGWRGCWEAVLVCPCAALPLPPPQGGLALHVPPSQPPGHAGVKPFLHLAPQAIVFIYICLWSEAVTDQGYGDLDFSLTLTIIAAPGTHFLCGHPLTRANPSFRHHASCQPVLSVPYHLARGPLSLQDMLPSSAGARRHPAPPGPGFATAAGGLGPPAQCLPQRSTQGAVFFPCLCATVWTGHVAAG